MEKANFSPSFKKTNHKPPLGPIVNSYQCTLRPTGVPVSMLAVCRGGAGSRTGPGARTRAGARLFVLSGGGRARARPGAGLGARLGPGGGSAAGFAPSR